ncbi:MAG: C-GCAxxG-C-C family protein [Chloroflexi bacterium]|nr:C-GCAxxG-C-C family protein [Chloroflexota bacterium]
MNKAETAVATFKQGFNCSQSVLSVFTEELGLDGQAAAKIASGFGGGIGHMAETCGAVTGAVMVIGLKNGMSIKDSPFKSNQLVYEAIDPFIKEFVRRNKSVKCRDLLGCDISDHETLLKARKDGLFQTLCPKFVNDAVEIVESVVK